MGGMLTEIIPLCDVPWPASVDTVDAGVGGEAFLVELVAAGGLPVFLDDLGPTHQQKRLVFFKFVYTAAYGFLDLKALWFINFSMYICRFEVIKLADYQDAF